MLGKRLNNAGLLFVGKQGAGLDEGHILSAQGINLPNLGIAISLLQIPVPT